MRISLFSRVGFHQILQLEKAPAFKIQYHKEKPSTLQSKSSIDVKQTHQLDLFTHFVAPQSATARVGLLFYMPGRSWLSKCASNVNGIRKKISIRNAICLNGYAPSLEAHIVCNIIIAFSVSYTVGVLCAQWAPFFSLAADNAWAEVFVHVNARVLALAATLHWFPLTSQKQASLYSKSIKYVRAHSSIELCSSRRVQTSSAHMECVNKIITNSVLNWSATR